MNEFFNNECSFFYQKSPTASMLPLGEIALTDFRLSGREAGTYPEYPDRGKIGEFKRSHKPIPGALINPGFSASRPFQETNKLWWLCDNMGLINYRVNYAETGVETDAENYDIALLFVQSETTNPSLDGGKAMQSGDVARQMTQMQSQARNGYTLLPFDSVSRLTTTEDQLANGVFFYDAVKKGAMRRLAGHYGVITVAAAGAATANVLFVDGTTITAGGADPFAADETPGFPIGVDLPRESKRRIIVFRTDTDAGNPAECAYCDDEAGTAWTAINIGSTNGEFITGVYKVHDGLIFVGTDGGNVYYSQDKCKTWTAASYPGTNDVRSFAFDDRIDRLWAVGDSAEIYYSDDNGLNFAAPSGALVSDVTGVVVNYEGHIFVIDGTTLKRSVDEAVTFSSVTVTNEAVTALKDIQFDEYGYTGIILVDDAGADDRVFRTEDGGVSFVAETTGTSNTGYNAAALVNRNLLFVVGDVVTTTWIEKIYGAGYGITE